MTVGDDAPSDVGGSTRWERVDAHYRSVMTASGPIEPREPSVNDDGSLLACTVSIRPDLATSPRSAVLVIADGATHLVEHADGVRLPRCSPSDDTIAVLVGARPALVGARGRFELELLADPGGLVEQLAWSPDGARLLAVVAEPGADAAGAQGSGRLATDRPEWAPHVMADDPVGGWRRVAVLRPGESSWQTVSTPGTTTWEAAWCGVDRVVAVQSTRPDEAAWFDATVVVAEVDTEADPIEVLRPPAGRCVGLPSADRQGERIAVVTATCSDRTVVAGDVTIIELGDVNGDVRPATRELDLRGVDATWLGWRNDGVLVVAGQRRLETVVAEVDVIVGTTTERWSSEATTCGERYPAIAVGGAASTAMVVEGYGVPPELALLAGSSPTAVTRLADDRGWTPQPDDGHLDIVRWAAADGLQIDGLLARPDAPGPHPVVTYVHGGPVWAWRSRWSMGYPYTLALVRAGFAVFHPNPRGSAGHGEEFRSMVIGDLGGAESDDILSGLDHLVAAGLADPDRLGVFGGSHGGFMAEHLVTIDQRFAAAFAYCPVSHWPTMRLTTNDIAAQDRLIGAGAPSPLDAVEHVTTPTFVSTGGAT